MEDLNKIATEINLHLNGVIGYLNSRLKECYSNNGKSRSGQHLIKVKEKRNVENKHYG